MPKAGDAGFDSSLTQNYTSLSGSSCRVCETRLMFLPHMFLP